MTRHKYGISAPVPREILGLQPRDKAAMLGGQYNRVFSRRISMKTEFSSHRREMLLFLTANMAAVTSRANQQYWLFSQDSRSYLKLGNRERERGTGKMKNGIWLGFFRVPVLPWSFPVPLPLFSRFGNIVGRRSRRKQKRREKEEGREISRIVLSSEAIVWLF